MAPHDSVLVKRGKVRGVDSACAHTTPAFAYVSWDSSKSDLDNYTAAVVKLIAQRNSEARVIAVARLPQSTLNGAPYAFLLSESL